jgi:SM-20-related protein|tara:strand:+ start:5799 stop:6314 length:516 start_codon:yes stop_codon:yes gene_type:complete
MSKKKIEVFDNFLSPNSAQVVFNTVIRSRYLIGWDDSYEPQNKTHPNLHSPYNEEDVEKIRILEPIFKKLNNKTLTYDSCVVNLTKPLDINFIHVHPDQIAAVYYANPTWHPEWGGETLFYEDNRKDIRLSSPYTPNRLIIFDGSIPHTIKAQNLLGPSYRFSVSLFFNKK